MRLAAHVGCDGFPCEGVVHERFELPRLDIDPASIRCALVAECPALDPADGFYGSGEPFFLQTTMQAFASAGAEISSLQDIADLGIHLTTAVKCAKIGNAVPGPAIGECSQMILEHELGLFPHLVVIVAQGDVAIRAVNQIARRRTGKRVIPAGSTYKIRGPAYSFDGIRVLPSYLMTGKSFLIEKSKQEMVAEDLRTALDLLGSETGGQTRF